MPSTKQTFGKYSQMKGTVNKPQVCGKTVCIQGKHYRRGPSSLLGHRFIASSIIYCIKKRNSKMNPDLY